jgi:cation diffusion facilitator family transporter
MAGKGESKVAVVAAIVGNLLVAIIKFVAAGLTGSSAMVAEGIHSLVDTGNGGLVLLGMRRSAKPADAQHPFGHGKALYFWTLIVAISIFGIGGGMSVYEGISALQHPAALENPMPNYIVLAVAFLVEGWAFITAMREFNKARGQMPALEFVRTSKDPSLFTVVFEDLAAMLGLVVAFLGIFLGHLFRNPLFDGGASVVIGLILMSVAALLARESKGLLVGEGVEPRMLDEMRAMVAADEAVERVGDVRTLYLGPNDLLVTLEVAFRPAVATAGLHDAIVRIEASLKAGYPEVRNVCIEVASLADAKAAEQG